MHGRCNQLLPAIAEVHTPEAGHRVEQAVPVGIPEICPFGPGDDPRPAQSQLAVIAKGMQKMLAVELLPALQILIVHTLSSRYSRSQGLITSKNA